MLIREIEDKLASRREISIREGIPVSTLNTWISEKTKTLTDFSTLKAVTKKGKRSNYPDIEMGSLSWFKEQRVKNIKRNAK